MRTFILAALAAVVVWLGVGVPAVHAQTVVPPITMETMKHCASLRDYILATDSNNIYKSIVCDDRHHTAIVTVDWAKFDSGGAYYNTHKMVVTVLSAMFMHTGYTLKVQP
jgi:hypothetical protein